MTLSLRFGPLLLGVQRVLSQFQKLPEMEQSKKMMNQESFLRQRITKASDNLKKQRKDNREKEVTQAMFQCLTGKSLQNLNLMDLNDLGWMIDQNLKEINKRFSTFQTATTSQMAAASMAGPSGEHASQRAEVQTYEVKNDNMQRQQWIVDFLTPQEPSGFGGPDEMLLPFVDNNQNPLWSNNFFP
ncbi:SERUM RESPONSE FACTOR-like protein [Salix koriyanagi]|uniref:SERUM RESPONSE FACTOR-like protein n=1 Tax=Salix koriyanagi TaxID=2511006 RepID=A0A9Q0VYG0_9ROSI|nr:SERUM RESPONSE FACTOR-like protein [Salix koriyanagi]